RHLPCLRPLCRRGWHGEPGPFHVRGRATRRVAGRRLHQRRVAPAQMRDGLASSDLPKRLAWRAMPLQPHYRALPEFLRVDVTGEATLADVIALIDQL